MNNKYSMHLMVVCMLFAFSCKSEVKSDKADSSEKITKTEEVKSPEITVNEGTKEVVEEKSEPEESTEEIKEVQETKSENSDNLRHIDKGIEIEMGIEEASHSKPEKEVKEQKEVKESKPEKKVKEEKPQKPEPIATFVGIPSHAQLNQLLRQFVSASGNVDYKGFKSKESELDEYLSMLESHPPETSWTRNDELAFWINAYNAYTIKLILKNYPVKSITDLEGGNPWDVKWINLDGKTLSLNNIENDIIRPKYKEPRIHFAVNCAAKSCPPLLNAAFKAATLDAQLEQQTKNFINNKSFNSLSKNEISVSKIFEWYGVDFGDIVAYVSGYSDTPIKQNASVTYQEYDWALNGK